MTYEELKADIAENGIKAPIMVAEDGTVLDGNTRAQIAQELGLTEIPAVVLPVSVVMLNPAWLKITHTKEQG